MLFQNWHEKYEEFWVKHLKVWKICTLIGSLWSTYLMYELRKVQRSYPLWHWRLIQNLKKKSVLWFGKWHEKFGKFTSEHLKVSKLGLWWDPFIQSWKCISLKFPEELCVMTMKNDAKFEKELTCHFKINMRNLRNFDLSTRKSEKVAL